MSRIYAINQRLRHIKKRLKLAWDSSTPGGYFAKHHPRSCSCRMCRFWNSTSKYRFRPKISDLRRMKNPDDD